MTLPASTDGMVAPAASRAAESRPRDPRLRRSAHGSSNELHLATANLAPGIVAMHCSIQGGPRFWWSERSDFPRDVAEMTLAYAISNKVEAAYRRGDLFEKRRQLIVAWADFLGRVEEPLSKTRKDPVDRASDPPIAEHTKPTGLSRDRTDLTSPRSRNEVST